MKFLDLFAGIGGFRLGLTRQGMSVLAFVRLTSLRGNLTRPSMRPKEK